MDLQTAQKRFVTHKATLLMDNDRYTAIDWRRSDNSSEYYVNYIIDKKRGSLIVSGDLGESIATWHNPLTVDKIKTFIHTDVGYYVSKIQCASRKYYFTSENIINDMKRHLKDITDDEMIEAYNENHSINDINEMWKDIEREVENCIYGELFIPNQTIIDFCEKLTTDYNQWLNNCGKTIHPNIYLWAEGLYMACDQLGI